MQRPRARDGLVIDFTKNRQSSFFEQGRAKLVPLELISGREQHSPRVSKQSAMHQVRQNHHTRSTLKKAELHRKAEYVDLRLLSDMPHRRASRDRAPVRIVDSIARSYLALSWLLASANFWIWITQSMISS
jgi:hypothetical protein